MPEPKMFEFECGCRWPIIKEFSDPDMLPLMDVDPDDLPDCPLTWDMISRGDTKGVFQLESRLGQTWAKKLKPRNFEHMSALGALLRPGAIQVKDEQGISATQHYCSRVNHEEIVQSVHPELDLILGPTEQILVYQEQSMRLGQVIAGFDLKNVDRLRKAIGKKDMKEMHEVKKLFLEGAKEKKVVPYDLAEKIWGWIEKSGRYQFNKSHSMSYGITGYQTAYLKTHFPIQYFTKWLEFSSEKIEPDIEKMELIEEAKKFDIKVNPPRIEFKKLTFHTDWKEIYFGLTDVKEIGEKAVTKLFEYLPEDVLGMDWNDWLYDVIPSNISTMTKLIAAGALDSIGMKRQKMLAELEVVADLTDKEVAWISENARSLKFIEALRLMAKPKKEGGGCANKNRIEKIKGHISLLENPPSPQDDAIPWLVWAEQKHLGVAVTCSKVESFVQEDVNSTCKDVQCGKLGMIVLGVEIMDFRVVKVKNGKSKGKEMAFLSVSDGTGTLNDVVCFADVWEDYRLFVSKGNTVYMQGERDPKNGSLIVRSISQLV